MAARRTSARTSRSAAAPDRRRIGEHLRAIRKAHRLTLIEERRLEGSDIVLVRYAPVTTSRS